METIVFLFVLAGFTTMLIASQPKTTAVHSRLVEDIARWLRGTTQDNKVSGALDGTPVTIAFLMRGEPPDREMWTEIDAYLPEHYGLSLLVREHRPGDAEKIKKGDMIDVQIGDPHFDAAFLVEAAPAEVAKRLFDERTRDFLMRRYKVATVTTHDEPLPLVRITLQTWIDGLGEATQTLDVAASIARRVRDAYADVEAQTKPDASGDPYRPVLDDTNVQAAATAREKEVVAVERVRHGRWKMTVWSRVGLGVLAAIAATIAGRC